MKNKFLLLIAFTFLASASVSAQQIKIAFVNPDSVLLSLPEYKTQVKILESYGKQLRTQITTKQTTLQSKAQEYQQQQPTLTPQQNQDNMLELQKMELELQQFAQQAQQNLGKKEQDLMEPLYEKIQEGIDATAKELGYDLVVQRQAFIYAKPEYDITTAVIKQLGGTPGAGSAE
ncbi:OmpH family outer membrane protein [Flammeovirgaceae bacterium SG7u.111]|nr:OmpH family outer membrane protein [Flammeovirgaceae bacterium SG7u.132]WPO38678.1 OmpH family outer membrane protein [Flammeovirgaceae bacterium SG7u.111]